MVLERSELVRPRVRGGDALGLEEVEGLTRVEELLEHHAAARRERGAHHHAEPRRPEEREGAPHATDGLEAQVLDEAPALQRRGAVRVQHALGHAGGPRGVDDQRVVEGRHLCGAALGGGVVDGVPARQEVLVSRGAQTHHGLEIGELAGHGSHLVVIAVMGEALLAYDHRAVRMREHVLDLGRLEQRVDRDQHRPRQGGAEGGLHPLGTVPHQQRHPRALARPRRAQRLGEAPGAPVELVVAPAPHRAVGLVEAQRLTRPVAGGHLGQQPAHGERADAGLGLRRRSEEGRHRVAGRRG